MIFQILNEIKRHIFDRSLYSKMCFAFLHLSVIVQWNSNKEPDLAGYYVFRGMQSRKYDVVVDVGLDTSYTINELIPGQRYYFAVKSYDLAGNESLFSKEVSIVISEGSDSEDFNTKVYNYPNPFNPYQENTHLRYYLEKETEVSIKIYDLAENLIRTLLPPTKKNAGEHTEDTWDGKNDEGIFVPNGVYLGIVDINGNIETIMIGLIR